MRTGTKRGVKSKCSWVGEVADGPLGEASSLENGHPGEPKEVKS